jgi:3,4-dihydroxy 2-butanone 4-phosphate synthase/GTP cyclohydrolase II
MQCTTSQTGNQHMFEELKGQGQVPDTTTTITFTCTSSARIPTGDGDFTLRYYRNNFDEKEHLALVFGDISGVEAVLVRVHSECFTGDVMGSLRCDCGPQLRSAMHRIAEAGRGVIIYLRQEGRGIGLEQKLRAYNLQDEGYDTVEANLRLGHQADERNYLPAAYILRDLGLHSIRLLTNNPAKIESLKVLGIHVVERVPLETPANDQNIGYLTTKLQRMHHLLQLEPMSNGHVSNSHRTGSLLPPNHPQVTHVDLFADLRHKATTHYARTGRPLVTVSYAQSLDGCLTAQPGQPLAISSAASLAWTHSLRAAHDAILVGIGTVLADDPGLTVRFAEGTNPQPVIVDSHLRLPTTAQVLQHHAVAWIAATVDADPHRRQILEAAGAQVLTLPQTSTNQVDLGALLDHLGQQGICSVMVEGGSEILTSFWHEGLVQLAVVTIAPLLLGGLPSVRTPLYALNGQGLHFPRLRRIQTFNAGDDIILWGEAG